MDLKSDLMFLTRYWFMSVRGWTIAGLFLMFLGAISPNFVSGISDEGVTQLAVIGWTSCAWAITGLSAIVAGELYGREVADGSGLFFAQLPPTRANRLFCKLVAVLGILLIWFLFLLGYLVLAGYAYTFPKEPTLKSAFAVGSILSMWLFCAGVSALLADRTGSLAGAFLVGFLLSATLYGFSMWFFQPDFGWKTLLLCTLGAVIMFGSLWIFSCDVEKEKL